MAGITTNMTNSFRQEILEAGHCFFQALTQTGNTFTTNNLINGLTSTANLAVGMVVTGGTVPASTFIGYIVNTTAVVVSNNSGSTATGVSLTFTGDTLKIALVKFGMAGTYDKTTSNFANVTTNSDEVSGAGYTTGGIVLTNVNPSVPDSNTAITNFSVNPSWTSATIDAAGCLIYNNSLRIGATSNHAVSLHDFGGEQKVTAGTFTVNMPTANGTAAILRLA